MGLSDEIDYKICLHNGFRLFNLPITAKQRKIRNEFADVQATVQLDRLDNTEGLDVYDNLPFPVRPKPNFLDYQDAKNRLSKPRSRFIDELFWFWPEDVNNKRDPSLKALKRGDADEALSIWQSSSAANADHNIAVYNQVLAIDSEVNSSGNDGKWREALRNWHTALSSNDFKNLVLQRVEQLNDPTLREDYVNEVFSELPLAILSINASFAMDYYSKGDKNNFERHLNLINESPFDSFTKENALSEIFDKLYDSVNDKFEEFEKGEYKKESDIPKLESFMDDVEDDMKLLKTHFEDNFQFQSLSDNVAQGVKSKYVGILNNMMEDNPLGVLTFDFGKVERAFDRLVDMAYAIDVKTEIENNLEQLKDLKKTVEGLSSGGGEPVQSTPEPPKASTGDDDVAEFVNMFGGDDDGGGNDDSGSGSGSSKLPIAIGCIFWIIILAVIIGGILYFMGFI